MKTLYIAEFEWQVPIIENEISEGDLIIAFNPLCLHLLQRKGLNCKDITKYYRHSQLWSRYPDTNDISFNLCSELDKLLFQLDARFANEKLNLFDYLHYIVKINLDQLYFYIYILSKIFAKSEFDIVKCSQLDPITFDESLLFSNDYSLVSHIVDSCSKHFGYLVRAMIRPDTHNDGKNTRKSKFPFGQPNFGIYGRYLKKMGYSLIQNTKTIFRSKREIKIGSVYCKDLDLFRKDLKKAKLFVINYNGLNERLYVPQSQVKYRNSFIQGLKKNRSLRDSLCFQNVQMLDLLMPIIEGVIDSINYYWRTYQSIKHFMNKNRFNYLFTQSLAPLYLPNMFFFKVCNDYNIPLVCWMHGGYGGNYSLPGYDVTDYRFGSIHFVYGEAVKSAVSSKKSILKQMFPNKKYECFIAGSSSLKSKYLNYARPQNAIKKVLLVIGGIHVYNHFYFGYNKEYSEFSNYRQHRAIIEELIKFHNRYEIIIKDYPGTSNMGKLWKSIINDNNANIKVITNEVPLEKLLSKTDLHIFTWVSTTFIESIMTDADVFLLDDSDLTDQSRKVLMKDVFFYDNTDETTKNLNRYLQEGVFYQKGKQNLIDFFLDGNKKNGNLGDIIDFLSKLRPEEADEGKNSCNC